MDDWLEKKWNEASWDGLTSFSDDELNDNSIARSLNPGSTSFGDIANSETDVNNSNNFLGWIERMLGGTYQVTDVQYRITNGPQTAEVQGFSVYFDSNMSMDISVDRSTVQNMINKYAEDNATSPSHQAEIVEQLNFITDYTYP